MLLGEYAALDGAPALALGLSARLSVTLERSAGGLWIDSPAIDLRGARWLRAALDGPAPLPRLERLWAALAAVAPSGGLRVTLSDGLPPRWGLGSSSALALAVVAAGHALTGGPLEPAELWRLAHGLGRRAQGGLASGYDVATQLAGGLVSFRWDGAPRIARVGRPALLGAPWVVGWTGRAAPTGEWLRRVRPTRSQRERIGALAERGLEHAAAGDLGALAGDLDEGHRQLRGLGAVPPDIDEACLRLAADPAVRGARLAGAGGGDCVVALAWDRGAGQAALRRAGLEPLPVTPDERGLCLSGPDGEERTLWRT